MLATVRWTVAKAKETVDVTDTSAGRQPRIVLHVSLISRRQIVNVQASGIKPTV